MVWDIDIQQVYFSNNILAKPSLLSVSFKNAVPKQYFGEILKETASN